MDALPHLGRNRLGAVAAEIESAKEKLVILQTALPAGREKEQLQGVTDMLFRVLGMLNCIEPKESHLAMTDEMYCEWCGSQLTYRIDAFPQGRLMASSDYIGGTICLPCMVEHCAQTNCLQCDQGVWPECKYAWIKKIALQSDSR